MPPTLSRESLATPLGVALVFCDDADIVHAIAWDAGGKAARILGRVGAARERRGGPAARALAAYYEGELAAVEALAVGAAGTAFQRLVWAALRSIPSGTTTSYGALARAIGKPAAVRAVGLANGANPINVVVPCHRVIGADGSLTGYGGGLARKQWLLAHEARHGRAGGAAVPLARPAGARLQPLQPSLL